MGVRTAKGRMINKFSLKVSVQKVYLQMALVFNNINEDKEGNAKDRIPRPTTGFQCSNRKQS